MFRYFTPLAAGVALLLLSRVLPFAAEDDAFIHFRVAKHFAELHLPYFNLSEQVAASTSLFWVACLSVLASFGLLSVQVLMFVNGALLALGTQLWSKLCLGSTGQRFRIPLTLAAVGALLPASLALMETPLALVLIGQTGLSLVSGSPLWAAWAVLAFFTRPEAAVFFIAAIPLLLRKRSGTFFVKSFGLGVLAVSPFLCLQFFYFGDSFLHTAKAKSIVYNLSFPQYISNAFTASLGEDIARMFVPFFLFCLMALSIQAINAWNAATTEKVGKSLRDPITLFSLGGVGVLLCYAFIRTPIFMWYPPLFAVPLLFAFARILAPLTRQNMAVLCSPFLLTFVLIVITPVVPEAFPFDASVRVPVYTSIGKNISTKCPSARIAAPEIGGLGWGYPGEILDGIGLATPRALAFHPLRVPDQRTSEIVGALPSRFAEEEDADVVVGLPLLLNDFVMSKYSERFTRINCPLPLISGRPIWGNSTIEVFVREDSPCRTYARADEMCG